MKKFKMPTNVFLNGLLLKFRPTGWEKEGSLYFKEVIEKNIPDARFEFMDSMWNTCFSIGSTKKDATRVMISGHIDQNALMVSEITKNGFCKVINQGGISPKVLVDTDMTIHTNEGLSRVPAFVGIKAIHLESQKERKEAPELKDIYLDLGCDSKDEVLEMGVRVGDLVQFSPNNMNIHFGKDGKYLVAPGVDDGCAIGVIYDVLCNVDVKTLKEKNICLYAVAMTGEEVGARGVPSAIRKIEPQYSIDIDVTHDSVKEIGEADIVGNDVRCDKGVVICYGPDKNRVINKELIELCEKNNIPYQVTAGKAGGTNTDSIQKFSLDCKTTLLSIPNLYMHSACHEKISWNDLYGCANLIKLWLEK